MHSNEPRMRTMRILQCCPCPVDKLRGDLFPNPRSLERPASKSGWENRQQVEMALTALTVAELLNVAKPAIEEDGPTTGDPGNDAGDVAMDDTFDSHDLAASDPAAEDQSQSNNASGIEPKAQSRPSRLSKIAAESRITAQFQTLNDKDDQHALLRAEVRCPVVYPSSLRVTGINLSRIAHKRTALVGEAIHSTLTI